jgi:hypothetical protein
MHDAMLTITRIYLPHVIAAIDTEYGRDYARKNPALVASCIQAITAEHRTQAVR